jgi:RNA polymerase sigma-70 factor (ECF subfamily)
MSASESSAPPPPTERISSELDEPSAPGTDTGATGIEQDGQILTPAIDRKPGGPMRHAVVRLFPPLTDAALVKALQARESGSAELLFERYGPYVERLIVRTVGLVPEVPDLIQEVLARALEGVRSLRESSALKGWIGSVALFTARGFLRSRRVRRRWLSVFSLDEVPEPAAVVASPEVSRTLAQTYAILDTLPADERIAFALRVIDRMDLAEISEVTGVSLATVKRRIARAQQLFWDRARRDPLLREHAPRESEDKEP